MMKFFKKIQKLMEFVYFDRDNVGHFRTINYNSEIL